MEIIQRTLSSKSRTPFTSLTNPIFEILEDSSSISIWLVILSSLGVEEDAEALKIIVGKDKKVEKLMAEGMGKLASCRPQEPLPLLEALVAPLLPRKGEKKEEPNDDMGMGPFGR